MPISTSAPLVPYSDTCELGPVKVLLPISALASMVPADHRPMPMCEPTELTKLLPDTSPVTPGPSMFMPLPLLLKVLPVTDRPVAPGFTQMPLAQPLKLEPLTLNPVLFGAISMAIWVWPLPLNTLLAMLTPVACKTMPTFEPQTLPPLASVIPSTPVPLPVTTM